MIKHEDVIRALASKVIKLEKEVIELKKITNIIILTQVAACAAFVVLCIEKM